MKWTEHAARVGEMKNAYNNLDGKPEETRPLGRLRHKWGNNIRMDLREIGKHLA